MTGLMFVNIRKNGSCAGQRAFRQVARLWGYTNSEVTAAMRAGRGRSRVVCYVWCRSLLDRIGLERWLALGRTELAQSVGC